MRWNRDIQFGYKACYRKHLAGRVGPERTLFRKDALQTRPAWFLGPIMDELDDHERIRRYRASIPETYNGAFVRTWDKAMTGKSLAAGAKAKCQSCSCWQTSEITNCQLPWCPLFPYRSYR